MRASVLLIALSGSSMFIAGCAEPTRPEPARAPGALASKTSTPLGGTVRLVNMMDACDPTTFNAVLGDGACVRDGGISFQKFQSLLAAHRSVGAWHFAPPEIEAHEGDVLAAVNRGGEVHTFTEVEEFGGGIVPGLNAASGNPVPAPECLALAPDDFVAPGATFTDQVEEPGTEKYQCCIHPWMRTVVHARAK